MMTTIFDDVSRPLHGTKDEQKARMDRVQAYCVKLPKNVQGAYMELAVVAGYDEQQLTLIEKWCARNTININDWQIPVLETIYTALEQKRVYETYFVNVAKAMEDQQKQSLAGFKNVITCEQKKVLDDFTQASAETASSLLLQLSAVEEMIKKFNPTGDLTARFSQAVLQGVSEGTQAHADAHADAFIAGMNAALSEHISQIEAGNEVLTDKIDQFTVEVQKMEQLDVPNLVQPLSHELKMQMAMFTSHAKAMMEELSAGMTAQAQAAAENQKKLEDETKKSLADMTQKAKRQFAEVTTAATANFEAVISLMTQVFEGKLWMERAKIWGGVAIIGILTGPVMNHLWFFRYIKH